jgi:hypothetical protein
MCPHVSPAAIEEDRQNLKDSVFAIKHDARFLYDEGDSMISLEAVRALIDNPPEHVPGRPVGEEKSSFASEPGSCLQPPRDNYRYVPKSLRIEQS